MNISTYESRIKALEDQLNPPGPSGDTGLLSVVVSPDITLSDGTSLNAKLAAMMPLAPGAEQRIEDTNARFDEDTEYTVTVKPGSKWYGIVTGAGGRAIGETNGTPVSLTQTPVVHDNNIILPCAAGASDTSTLEGQASRVQIGLSRGITN